MPMMLGLGGRDLSGGIVRVESGLCLPLANANYSTIAQPITESNIVCLMSWAILHFALWPSDQEQAIPTEPVFWPS